VVRVCPGGPVREIWNLITKSANNRRFLINFQISRETSSRLDTSTSQPRLSTGPAGTCQDRVWLRFQETSRLAPETGRKRGVCQNLVANQGLPHAKGDNNRHSSHDMSPPRPRKATMVTSKVIRAVTQPSHAPIRAAEDYGRATPGEVSSEVTKHRNHKRSPVGVTRSIARSRWVRAGDKPDRKPKVSARMPPSVSTTASRHHHWHHH